MMVIDRERAKIISDLHSVKSVSELHRGMKTCNDFARSHRIREIVSFCADRRCDFSADDYHDHDHGNNSNELVASVTEPDDVAAVAWTSNGATSDRRSWSSSYLGGTSRSRCWSCTTIDRETDDDDDDDDNVFQRQPRDRGRDAHYRPTSEHYRSRR